MNNNLTTSNTADRWLTPMETLRLSGSKDKSAYALVDKSSGHFLLGFPRAVNDRWLESDVQKYLATQAGNEQSIAPQQPINTPLDRRANTERRQQ